MNIVENQSRNSYTPGFLTNMETKLFGRPCQ